MVALWFGTLALAFAYCFNDHVQRQVGDQGYVGASGSVSTMRPIYQELTTQADQLAKSLSSSTRRLNRLETAVPRTKDRKRLAGPTTQFPQPPRSAAIDSPEGVTASITVLSKPSSPNPTGTPQIQPYDLAVPHQAADGTVDYCVLPHGPVGNSPTKVMLVGKAAHGVVVDLKMANITR